MFEAVLFDWDGTLADTRQAILLSFKRALKKTGTEVPDEFIERRIGIGAKRTFREILLAKDQQFDDLLIEDLVNEKIRAEIDLSDTISLLPGVDSLLKSLHGKLPLALASMNNRAVIDHLLEKLNLNRYFKVTVTVEEVVHPKPDPEIFLTCASRLGVSPRNCLVVEDSVFGVSAAKAAGTSCLAVSTGAYGEEELVKLAPDLLVSSLSDTTELLRFILQ
jgi:HAD superfamily hydrolase (TIGR01509 family)